MDVRLHNDFWLIDEMQVYNPEKSGEREEREDRVRSYVDKFVNEFVGDRSYENGLVVISGPSYNELSKVESPVFEEIIDHRDKTYYVRYARSIKIL
jgi:hypothetical protein